MKKFILFFSLLLSVFTLAQGRMKDYKNIMKSTNIYELDAFLRDAHEDDPRRDVLKPRLIELINNYIKTAHPEDQRVGELQQKLARLKKFPSTKISFDEMTADIKRKQMEIYKQELARRQSGNYNRAMGVNDQPKSEEKSVFDAESTPKNPVKNQPSYTNTAPKNNNSYPSYNSNTTSNSASSFKNTEQDEYNQLMNMSDDEHKKKTVKILNALFDNDPQSKETTVMIENKSDCDMIMRIEGTGDRKYKLPVPAKGQNTIVILKGQYLFSSKVCGAQYASQKTVEKAIMVALGGSKK